jgi:DNA polymerase III delta prime subunit
MVTYPNQFIWTEKYRPRTIEDCVLPEQIKSSFRDMVKEGRISHLLLSGTAGTGKTTISLSLCNEIGAEYLLLNGSDAGRHIETLRSTIRQFASTISLTDAKKVVIIDESDFMNAQSVQPALRAFIEEFSANCSFILTCNYKARIIEPLHSRCSCIDFKIDNKDRQIMAATFFKRAIGILKNENIEFDPKVVAEIITKYFPDYRRVINELQRYSGSGKLETSVLVSTSEDNINVLFKYLKEKNFTDVRKWVTQNSDIESAELYRKIYDKAITYIELGSIPDLVLTLAEYGYKSAFSVDQEINNTACLVEIMISSKFI